MKKSRIAIIDILRGFALLLIVLIHFIEHFEFYSPPKHHFIFSPAQDERSLYWVMQFIRGNAYAIFALLFGLSFYIQMNNKAKKGINYTKGFAWRMFILLIIGFFFSLIYRGDILHMYALFALPVLFIYPLNSKFLFVISILLLLQLPLLYKFIISFYQPDFKLIEAYPHWAEGNQLAYDGSFWETVKFNFYKGRHTAWTWTIYVGRYLQIWGLFILGILLGRISFFKKIEHQKALLIKIFIVSLFIALALAFTTESLVNKFPITVEQQKVTKIILNSWKNIFGLATYVSLISLLYIAFPKAYLFKLFQAYGKLSLTNYIVQGTVGVFLYYGFGLALWKYLGDTWSLISGVIFFLIQAYLCTIWNSYFYYGPFEWLWRCLTDLNLKTHFKKPQQPIQSKPLNSSS